MTEKQTMVITISRQLASGGAYIGHLVAKKLGYKYVEREVLYRAAGELGVDIAELSRVGEGRSRFMENLMKSFSFGTPEAAYVPPSRRPVYDAEVLETESRIIKTIAERYNCVIVGRAGFFVLRERPGVVNVFVHAPQDFRIRRLQKFHEISTAKARAEIEESDGRRGKFIRTMTGSEWCDARNYHLCIDAEASGFETAQQMIIALADKIKKDVESKNSA